MNAMGWGMGISLVTMVLGLVVPLVIFGVVFRALGLSRLRNSVIGLLWSRIGFQWRLLWWLLASGFIGLMIATAGGAIHPPLVQPAAQLLCDGEVSLRSQGYSYKPGQSGVAHTITCTSSEGDKREITFQSVFFAAALYGAVLFVLHLLWWLLRRRSDAPDPDAATGLSPDGVPGGSGGQGIAGWAGSFSQATSGRHGGGAGVGDLGSTLQGLSSVIGGQVAKQVQDALKSATASHANVTVNGREVPMNDDIHQRLRDALQKVSDGKGVTLTSTTVNGQPVGGASLSSDAATRLQQLQRLRDQGLVSAAEFDAKRAEILRAL